MILSPTLWQKTNRARADSLGTGMSVAITGTWQAAPPQKEQPHELKAMAVKIIGAADPQVCKTHSIDLQYLRCGF